MQEFREPIRGLEAGQVAMTTASATALPTAFLERLMIRIDPHQQPAPDEALINAQHSCGRWFALRRLQLALTSTQVAGMTDVSVEAIQLLEAGLADTNVLSTAAQRRLSRWIAGNREDITWVENVIAIALGCAEAMIPDVMDRVVEELEAIETGVTKRELVLTSELVAQPDSPPPFALEKEPGMFEVLRVLLESANYTYAIWEKVHEQLRTIAVAEIGILLTRMLNSNLITEAGVACDITLDDEPLQYYQISAEGEQAYALERVRRAIETQRKAHQEAVDKQKAELGASAPVAHPTPKT